jgi:hypothetical protein
MTDSVINCIVNSYKKLLLLFLFSLAIISANAYNAFLHYDFPISVDDENYFKMAQGNYDVNITRKYRVIIPIASSIVASPITKIYKTIWPHRPDNSWPLRMGFLLVNSLIMTLSGVLIFLLCEAYGTSPFTSLITTIVILTCRWTTYFAGTISTDSLYFFIILLVMYGIKIRNKTLITIAIFIGPFAKESFIFIAPLIFFFSSIPKKKQIILFLLSGIVVFSVRSLIDYQAGTPYYSSLNNAFEHFDNFQITFFRLFSPKGFFEVFSVLGIYFLIIIMGFTGGKDKVKRWLKYVDIPLIILFLIIWLHVFLSAQIGRMLYYASPFWAITIALIIEHHPRFDFLMDLQIIRKFHLKRKE